MAIIANIIDFKGKEFGKAVYERGWTYSRLSVVCGKNKQYLRQAMANGRINSAVFCQMCDVIGVDPDQFTGHEDYVPLKIPDGPIRLDTEGVVALFTAIVTRAKEDYILAYRDHLTGKCKVRDGHMTLRLATIEYELGAEWFKDHLIGAVTTNARAVDTMIRQWRREAERGIAR